MLQPVTSASDLDFGTNRGGRNPSLAGLQSVENKLRLMP